MIQKIKKLLLFILALIIATPCVFIVSSVYFIIGVGAAILDKLFDTYD